MTDHDGVDHTDGGGRSPRVPTDNTTLGVSRVRPHRARHPPAANSPCDEELPRDHSREPAGFEPRQNRDVTHERWKAMAFVCFVLVTLALVAETGVQLAAGVDVLALGPRDGALLRRIDSALATTARRARYVAVAAGGFAVVGVAVATLVAVARTPT